MLLENAPGAVRKLAGGSALYLRTASNPAFFSSSLQFFCADYFFSELLQRLCQTGALPLRDLGIVGVVKKTNEIYGYEGLRQQDLKACFGTPT